VPVQAGTKDRPLVAWKTYQSSRADWREVAAWLKQWPDMNLAIVTGAVSGVFVLDLDSAEAVAEARKLGSVLNKVWRRGRVADSRIPEGALEMAKQVQWLSDEEWARIEPLLPRGRKGAHRVDDRRVISGIVHMLKSGARWRDCPPEFGPYTTVYNRFNRWSRQGLWLRMFEALTGHNGIFDGAAIDATHVKAHRSAAGAKGGPSPRP